jgi:hypothetical protein
VLDVERYLAGPTPMVEKLTMKPTAVGGGMPFWDDVMGQQAILTALRAWNDTERAGLGARGSVADRLLAYEGADETQRGHAVWQTLWQDGDWAEAFFRAMGECLRQRYETAVTGKETGIIRFEAKGRHVTLMKNRGGAGVLLVDAGDGQAEEELVEAHGGE